jgi:ADP-heptose:LPS heptosyltransferase
LADEIWFASLIPEIVGQAKSVTVACTARLVPLFRRSFPSATIIEKTKRIDIKGLRQRPEVHAAYMDAAEWLRPSLEAFTAQPVGYLTADAERSAIWKNRLAAMRNGRPVVAISWRSTRSKLDAVGFTYPKLADVAALINNTDALWINLQYDDPDNKEAAQLNSLCNGQLVTLEDLDLKDDLEGQAALFANCDAVIGPANAPTILAAATGCPTISLWSRSLRIYWRDHAQADKTPWFPNMQLARRRVNEPWSAAIQKAQAMLNTILRIEPARIKNGLPSEH